MRIVEIFPVAMSGTLPGRMSLPMREFMIQHDDRKCEAVTIPDLPHIVEQFQWLSDEDKLRHLVALTPGLETNREEIEIQMEVEKMNSMNQAFNKSFGGGYPTTIKSYPAPDFKYTIIWKFTDRDTSLMFKLRFGGEG